MSQAPRTKPTLHQWAALDVLCRARAHGWAVARELAASGSVGRVYSCTRPLVYRALRQLRQAERVEVRGTGSSETGPAHIILGPTRRGRARFVRWRGTP